MAIFQILVRLLDGKTRCLQITYPCISGDSLRSHLYRETRIPPQFLRLVSGSREIRDETLLSAAEDGSFPSCTLLLRLPGGKGGFGSLLRGAATKAGQKKTSNFDACRDMSGRRLRHVNAEKKLEEWKAGADVRRLEKVAEQFLKKKAKEAKKRPNGNVERYIQKYREDSERCMEEVEESVKQSFLLYEKSKRKVLPSSGPASKRVKLWLGKEKVDDSDDSEDSDDEDDDATEKKSVVIDDNVNHWEGEGSSGTASGRQSDGESSGEGSDKSILEDENGGFVQNGVLEVGCSTRETDQASDSDGSTVPEVIIQGVIAAEDGVQSQPSEVHEVVVDEGAIVSNAMVENQQHDQSQKMGPLEQFPSSMDVDLVQPASQPPKPVNADSCVVPLAENSQHTDRSDQQMDTSNSGIVETACEGTAAVVSNEGPLNFDDFNTPAELENLGMERLKSELQERGLKCGGTLQERAARLFLVKTTPLDKLPKKLFAKSGAK